MPKEKEPEVAAEAKSPRKEKASKGKKPKKKKQKKIKGNYYETAGGGLKRTKKTCPKCGSGIFMAEHKDRYTCGRCAYTDWKQGASEKNLPETRR